MISITKKKTCVKSNVRFNTTARKGLGPKTAGRVQSPIHFDAITRKFYHIQPDMRFDYEQTACGNRCLKQTVYHVSHIYMFQKPSKVVFTLMPNYLTFY